MDTEVILEVGPDVTPETVEGYFGEYGWSFETLGPGLWRTGFRGENAFHTIYVRLTEGWLYMTISPFVPAPTLEPCTRRTSSCLARRLVHSLRIAT